MRRTQWSSDHYRHTSDTGKPANGTQAIDRAALLVAAVVRADEPMSFLDLHDACGLPKSTTSRLLSGLERTELIERNASGSYVAGPLFWLYATRHDPWEELVRLARPTLERLGEETRETVNLAVTRGDRVVQVAQVDSQFMLGTRDWTEVDVPAHCSALGKVLFAYGVLDVPPGRLEQLTPHTVDRDELLEQLASARAPRVRHHGRRARDRPDRSRRTRARRARRSDRGAGRLGSQPASRTPARRGRPAIARPGRAAVRGCSAGEHARRAWHD